MASSSRNLVPAFAALAALGLGVFAATQFYPPAVAKFDSGIYLPQSRAVSAFELTDQDDQPFTNAQLQGHWTILFAGFTHCPDVCPSTLSLLKHLSDRMLQSGRRLDTVFLSVDPERDTPEQLLSYVRYFSPDFTGISGSKQQLDSLTASLGLAYVKVPGASDADYTMDHSAAMVLLNPEGQVAGYFQPPFKIDLLASDLERVIRRTP